MWQPIGCPYSRTTHGPPGLWDTEIATERRPKEQASRLGEWPHMRLRRPGTTVFEEACGHGGRLKEFLLCCPNPSGRLYNTQAMHYWEGGERGVTRRFGG